MNSKGQVKIQMSDGTNVNVADLLKDLTLGMGEGASVQLNEALYNSQNAVKLSSEIKNEIKRNKIDVVSYGVKGDGSDETIKIQSIVNDNKGIIYFPEGNYKISETINITQSGVIMEFSPNANVIFEKTIQNTPAIQFKGSENNPISINQPLLEGTYTIQLSNVPNGLMVNDWIQLSSDEIFNSNARSYDTKREYNKITEINKDTNTITLSTPLIYSYDNTKNIKLIKQNFLKNVGVYGLKLNGIGDNLHIGVRFDKCFNPIITGCNIHDIGNTGIYVMNSIFGSVHNNYIQINYKNSLQYGIVIHGSSHLSISENHVHSSRTSIDITRLSSFITVNGNTSYDGAINTHTSKYVDIVNNTIHGGHTLVRGSYTNVINNIVVSGDEFSIDMQEAASGGFIKIKNNIFVGNQQLRVFCSNVDFSDNLYIATSYLTYDAGKNSSLIRFEGGSKKKNIFIKNNNIQYIGNAPPKYGIHSWGIGEAENIVIEGNVINGCVNPINFLRVDIQKRKGLKIINNTLYSLNGCGIYFGGWDQVTIKDNLIIGLQQMTEGIQSWGSSTESYEGFMIKDNMIENVIIPLRFHGGNTTQKLMKKSIIKDNIYSLFTSSDIISGVNTSDGSNISGNF